jgi:hypothetical protein
MAVARGGQQFANTELGALHHACHDFSAAKRSTRAALHKATRVVFGATL